MKKTILALATVLAFSGAAFAGTSHQAKQAPAAACVQTNANVKLDCGTTGSVEKTGATTKTDAAKGQRLGIEIDPWIVPSTF
ncbi:MULTISPECIES: DUF680 domain-containing protein [Mesorhizobium]|uniref:DUF680 domain-containing protein n=1 Tax=Mesorhizobium abyssinicae TaxID=1209958 RepID=A0ABU5AGT1_9HYPH|nr:MULTISPECIES: DUF680 domain-containing protein [Mesorhizobium]MDX8536485.1 DUF680 domain-containing protein [Mesorhizobium abyssinicae]RUW24455.1 DUF680 domain-containing protein [Mesorhizobium sp. M4B.F.Ca.ET.013.02.1.1]RUW78106.1 DUF680 domain-containing protein [Mesorhizobium sp. M4B.F.Ca.ET.049.02.1.2]RVD19782.1 DUF680 domain-containing protein [Mesorhizobium sp. M4B.F.Ca.ET.017.02.2.1]RVD45450.1 DUF680 domain-containing protein [Mesorhizobium sp. M4B.F.Ca.ET.019.03.1.1]